MEFEKNSFKKMAFQHFGNFCLPYEIVYFSKCFSLNNALLCKNDMLSNRSECQMKVQNFFYQNQGKSENQIF